MAEEVVTNDAAEETVAPEVAEETVAAAAEETIASEYTAEDIKKQIKPLSQNGFVRAFQRLYRWWQGVWAGFSDKHPKLSSLIYKVFFFFVFSMGVTIWQYIVMAIVPMFLPKTGPVGWPAIEVGSTGQQYVIFGDAEGWAKFICFEIAVFTAQCINFPLQRNITYRSHGNPWYQAMWYFIGWVLVSIATNAIWGICNVFLLYWNVPEAVRGLGQTVLTGGVSMVVFFFIFMVIFPDNNKMAKNARAKYEKLVAANAPAEKVAAAEAKMNEWEKKALLSNTDKELAAASSLANAKAVHYFAVEKNKAAAEADVEKQTDTEKKAKAEALVTEYTEKLPKAFEEAIAAIKAKTEKQQAYDAARA